LRKPGKGEITIAMVGKYVDLTESYKSLNEALTHGGIANDCAVKIEYIDSEEIEKTGLPDSLKQADGILVPGGFGKRGSEGKILAVQYARENNIPFLGICLGLQMAVVEYARNKLNLSQAASGEFVPDTADEVIHLMETQHGVTDKGATMRLGGYPCVIQKGSLAYKVYGKKEISERHRHRWEVNNVYRERLEAAGMVLSGLSPDQHLVEIVEVPNHKWFLGVQFHPEFLSKPLKPHPLFSSYVEAALSHRESRLNHSGAKQASAGN